MKAIACSRPLPSSDPAALFDLVPPDPVLQPRDLLVRVEAISVNPVDTKVRRSANDTQAPRVLGWDAAGVVEAVGQDVTLFRPGDAVYYAGALARPGTNSELHGVDERLVGRRPTTLTPAEAAALPLTAITAWEALFERLGIDRAGKTHRGQTLLVIGAAGGVGSIAIQLAKLAGLTVLATASRPETQRWVRQIGADHVLDHREPLAPQLKAAGVPWVDFIANFADTDRYWTTMAEVIRPQGKIVSIVENEAPLDLNELKSKSATFVWEFMFTRAMFETPDMIEQHRLLTEVSALVDGGKLRTTLTETLGMINAANLRQAHARLESGRMVGKLALVGW